MTRKCGNPDCPHGPEAMADKRANAKTCSPACRQAFKRRKTDSRSKAEREAARADGLFEGGEQQKAIRRELAYRELLPPVFKAKPDHSGNEWSGWRARRAIDQNTTEDRTSHESGRRVHSV